MTVGKLKKELEKFDNNLEVVYMDDIYGWQDLNSRLVNDNTCLAYSNKSYIEL